jgi:cyclophilin family peptidyl-prolyl cis-trans isomerase
MSRRIAFREAERRRAARRRAAIRAAQIGVPVVVIGMGLVLFLVVRAGRSTTTSSNAAVTDVSKSSVPTTTEPGVPLITPTVTSCAQGVVSPTVASGKPQFPTPPVMMIDPKKSYRATFDTSKGTIVAQLSPTVAPVTVNSFVFLARCGFFDGTIIHRISKNFVIQGGDPTGTGTGGPGYTLPDELPKGPGYQIGSLAMANTGRPNTGGSQFFIVTGAMGTTLGGSYTLFGGVISGQDIAKAIENLPIQAPPSQPTQPTSAGQPPSSTQPVTDGKPQETVMINKVTIQEG